MPKRKVEKEIIYCSNIKCNQTDCLRNKSNAPWGVLIKMAKFELDKNEKCKYKLEK